MATCEKIPPEPEPPIYRLDLSEDEAKHVRSVIGRLKYSAMTNEYESSACNSAIFGALRDAEVPGGMGPGFCELVNA